MMSPKAIFVYGTLKPGHCRWDVLAHLLSTVSFEMRPAKLNGARMYDVGSFPAITHEDGVVKGVLIMVDPLPELVLQTLDAIEGYVDGDEHNLYNREVVSVVTPGGEVEAYAYFFARETNNLPVIPDGVWRGC